MQNIINLSMCHAPMKSLTVQTSARFMHAYFGQGKGQCLHFISIFHWSSSLSICTNERKRLSRPTYFGLPHVCSFGNNVLLTER